MTSILTTLGPSTSHLICDNPIEVRPTSAHLLIMTLPVPFVPLPHSLNLIPCNQPVLKLIVSPPPDRPLTPVNLTQLFLFDQVTINTHQKGASYHLIIG